MSPMDFKAARSKVRGMVASKKPQDLQRSVLTPDPLRDNIINEAAEHSERFMGAINQRPRIDYEVELEDGTKEQRHFDWTTWPEMLRDAARMAFSYDEPEIAPADRVRPSARLNHAIAAQMMLEGATDESRPYTRGNEMESLFDALARANDLRESAKTRLAEHIARSEEMREQEDQILDAEQMMDGLRQRAREMLDQAGQISDELRDQIKSQVKRREAARDALAGLIQQQNASTMVSDAIAAAQSAAQAGANAMDALSGMGDLLGGGHGLGAGQSRNMSPDQQIALAEKWMSMDRLREIAKMIGRMYRDMRFQRETRVKNVPIEPVGVTVGDNLDRMLPLEAARAVSRDPLARFTFVRDWAAGHLLEYEMQGKMPAGKGPIITVVDGSGSMGGEKIIWANSLGLSLFMLAHREKRDFAQVQFGSGKREIKVWHFPKHESADPDEVIDMASHLFGGGTTTVEGMAAALDIIDTAPEFKTADIVLIADGQDHFAQRDHEIRDQLRAKDVRIHGISILSPENVYMQQMCEYVEDVIDLAGANDTTTKVAQNIT